MKSTAKNTRRSLIIGSLLLISNLSYPALALAQNQPLRASADLRGIRIGAAVAMTPFRSESDYQDTLKREFNIIVAENAFKWASVRPSRSTFNFTDS